MRPRVTNYRLLALTISAVAALTLTPKTASAGTYSMPITFTNFLGKGTLTNFPALVKLTQGNAGSCCGVFDTADGCDLHFLIMEDGR